MTLTIQDCLDKVAKDLEARLQETLLRMKADGLGEEALDFAREAHQAEWPRVLAEAEAFLRGFDASFGLRRASSEAVH